MESKPPNRLQNQLTQMITSTRWLLYQILLKSMA